MSQRSLTTKDGKKMLAEADKQVKPTQTNNRESLD